MEDQDSALKSQLKIWLEDAAKLEADMVRHGWAKSDQPEKVHAAAAVAQARAELDGLLQREKAAQQAGLPSA